MTREYDGIGLFSGGLDGLLAIKVLEEQGLKMKALHFYSPFFGHPRKRSYWKRIYGMDVDMIDIGQDFVDMLAKGPVHGVGKTINPCVDCKILLFARARQLMSKYGAKFLASGEVIGQRPMSQRRDTLNIISRDANIRDVLLRPLSAKCLNPTPVEESGLVDREQLLGIWGRGRKEQFALAKKYGIEQIPTPAGGCLLTEKENARRFWPIFKYLEAPGQEHFHLSNVGRQFWSDTYWLSVGRHERDNQRLQELAKPGDVLFHLTNFPGPLALGRNLQTNDSLALWSERLLREAAILLASFSPKATATEEEVEVLVTRVLGAWEEGREVEEGEEKIYLKVMPCRESEFKDLTWDDTGPEIKARYKMVEPNKSKGT